MTNNPTDIAVSQDSEGYFDMEIDTDARDFEMTSGLDSALIVSVLSDARAYDDEIPDPLKRRGWPGDMVSETPGDRHGSVVWFYLQSRSDISEGVRLAAYDALEWMIDERIATSRDVTVTDQPGARSIAISIALRMVDGGTITRAFALATATVDRVLAKI